MTIIENLSCASAFSRTKLQLFIPEIDEDVNDEHDVHYEVHHVERGAGVTTALHGCLLLRGEVRRRVRGRTQKGQRECENTGHQKYALML